MPFSFSPPPCLRPCVLPHSVYGPRMSTPALWLLSTSHIYPLSDFHTLLSKHDWIPTSKGDTVINDGVRVFRSSCWFFVCWIFPILFSSRVICPDCNGTHREHASAAKNEWERKHTPQRSRGPENFRRWQAMLVVEVCLARRQTRMKGHQEVRERDAHPPNMQVELYG